MAYSDLNLKYYFDDNGEEDEFINICRQCVITNIYLVLKQRLNYEFDPYDLFMADTTPLLMIDQEKKDLRMVNFLPHEPKFLNEIKINITIKEYEPDAVKILEDLVNQGEKVILQTVFYMLPGWIIYRPGYNYESDDKFERDAQHALLVLWHDKDYFYCVENIGMLYPDKCQFYNKEVVKIKKAELAEPMGKYMKCTTFDIDEHKFKNRELNYDLIKQIVKNYDTHHTLDNNIMKFYGLNAIRQLINICENRELFPEFELVYGNFEVDLFRLIIFRKVILYRWLLKHSHDNALCESALDVINAWRIAKSTVIKNVIRKYKVPRLEPCLRKCFENLLAKEETFIANLKRYLKI